MIEDSTEQSIERLEQEDAQSIANKRDRLYLIMQIASVIFAVVSIVLLVEFKNNEGFFGDNSHIDQMTERTDMQKDDQSEQKVNVLTTFQDEEGSRLVIPQNGMLDKNNIRVTEEFIQNKYVITLLGYSKYVPYEMKLVSDSTIMNAVGVYRQNDDVVVEIYCRDLYDYELVLTDNALTVNFKDRKENYNAFAVIWFPYEERTCTMLSRWRKDLDKFAADNKIKLYIASDMQEAYTQEDVILFANKIRADMVLGVQVEESGEQQSYMTGICNTAYFIPGYNSTLLSVVMTEAFAEATQIKVQGFEEGNSDYVLVSEATVPSAVIRISQAQVDREDAENEYKLYEGIAVALKNTMEDILESYLNMEEL